MKFKQIKKIIKRTPSLANGYKMVITYDNACSYDGMFDTFNDSKELKKQNKWRFIPKSNIKKYLKDLYKLRKPDPDHSIIIDGDAISKIEIVKSY
jgi:hypothetical protein